MLPWYFWLIVALLPIVGVGLPLWVNWRKKR
jgi:hypothetical protein